MYDISLIDFLLALADAVNDDGHASEGSFPE